MVTSTMTNMDAGTARGIPAGPATDKATGTDTDTDTDKDKDTDTDDAVLMLSTAPDALLAKRIAHVLVEEGLAACVNLGAESLSMYMWQGVLEGASEVSLTIKTRASRAQDVANRLGQLHPYDVPEILVMGPLGGSRAYLRWLAEQTEGMSDNIE